MTDHKKQDYRIGQPQVGAPAMTVHPSTKKQPEQADDQATEQRKDGDDRTENHN